uniref:Uncharacterized protein n=1 Tax=Chromera velia CCMP2878 TaxID=1169474 RepID=A0A0G4HW47_9ALVE|eukprot:Cvel_8980.t1-p1 / transcript=Cvel_8980.t1 / gene=Cvel_8980 / organism=Chromera_velia_CCMP2878 / gene_product=hypothetical protein / transcript_product=hypothetical protein / location=Cvel_scaffold506:80058-80896(-) / protein_length=205 / sequence_SO=supercontig / SO=protein_coding / is_pseudo=false
MLGFRVIRGRSLSKETTAQESDGTTELSEAYRSKCLKRERNYVAGCIPAFVAIGFIGPILALCRHGGAMKPELAWRASSVSEKVKDKITFWGLLVFVVSIRVTNHFWQAQQDVFTQSALIVKMFLMNLHIPTSHFIVLSLVDSVFWLFTGLYHYRGASSELSSFLNISVVSSFVIPWGLRQLPMRTLSESDSVAKKEGQQRVIAE